MPQVVYKLALFFIKFRCFFIFNKKKRRRIRNFLNRKLFNRFYRTIKWGVSYSVFDGEELLRASLLSIRSSVDYINVVYQFTSWTGKHENKNIKKYLDLLKKENLIDEIIEFTPNYNLSPGINEREKRNLGLSFAQQKGCDYFMTMDTDEFYKKDQFEKAKRFIVENDIDKSFCPIINYGFLPTKRVPFISDFAVQFFCKVKFNSKLGFSRHPFALVDPTRGMNYQYSLCSHSNNYFFCDLQMHHMSIIRKNLNLKFSSSSNKNLNSITEIEVIRTDKHKTFVDVDDIFNINNELQRFNQIF